MAAEIADLIITQPSEREIRIERTFDAPPELVWRALTEAPLAAGMAEGLAQSYAALDDVLSSLQDDN